MYYFVLLHKHLTKRKKPSPFIHQKESALPFIHVGVIGLNYYYYWIIFYASLFERNNINIELDISSLAQPLHGIKTMLLSFCVSPGKL